MLKEGYTIVTEVGAQNFVFTGIPFPIVGV